MCETNLQCYVNAVFPGEILFYDNDKFVSSIKYHDSTLLELCDSDIYFNIGSDRFKPSISIVDGRERKYLQKKYHIASMANEHKILSISGSVDLDCYMHLDDGTIKDFNGFIRKIALLEFCKRITDIIIITNIARVGSVGISDSIVIQDNMRDMSKILPDLSANSIFNAKNSAEEHNWPKFADIKIADAWNWAMSNHLALDAFDGTQLGRALSAFSRIFEYSKFDELVQLVWAMVGIEAIFGKESNGIMEQLREKAEVIFGEQEQFKKRISKMYKFRSKFIHGKLDFPCANFLYDGAVPAEKFDAELFDSCYMAIAILCGALQYIAANGWSGLSFKYKVEESN